MKPKRIYYEADVISYNFGKILLINDNIRIPKSVQLRISNSYHTKVFSFVKIIFEW